MNYNIEIHENFTKEFKPLFKKIKSLSTDLKLILDEIEKELILADDLGDGFKKIRFNIKSKGKDASGGGTIITKEVIISVDDTKVVFLSIYNKGDFDNIDLTILKKNLGIS